MNNQQANPEPSSFLDERNVDPNPFRQFERWFCDAQATKNADPSAMTLATATREGAPSARIVLLKGFDETGFVFYTNYLSRKGHELMYNPRAALLFHWPELVRQVRLEGIVHRVSAEESDAYFRTRPWGSRIGALASDQSRPAPDRASLEARAAELAAQYRDSEVPRPPHWGGYRLAPEVFEYWQGRQDRLHDRIQYTRKASGAFHIERLSP